MDFIESKTRALDLQARLVAIERLAWRAIQHFKQDAYADQRAAELNIQASKAFCRLIGQQEGGDEGEELARRRARLDHPVSPIGNGGGDRTAAERFH
jgi:hypothetical protein